MKRRSPLLAALTLLIPFSLCILGLVIVVLTQALPRRAALSFGFPTSDLDYPHKLYFAALLVLQEEVLMIPVDSNGQARQFEVALGEPTAAVIQRLHEEGFIASVDAFRTFLLYSGLDRSIQAGNYQLSPAMNAIEIAHNLQDATPAHVTFRIFPGWRLEEIAAALPTSGMNFSPDEFLAATRLPRNGFIFSSQLPPDSSLEGFFFPDTYEITRTTTLEGFIRIALDNFQAHLTPELQAGFANQGLQMYAAVTLASVIEREAILEDEMPLIASVFYNRLAAGMKLDSDPTVQYALGFNREQNTWWTNPLSLEDLEVTSVYNTYQSAGLPPSPISNPGLSALQAVAYPASSSFYYFRATCDGSGRHSFAKTFEEHVANACP